jgi:biopolymer transport protein ExbD
MAGSTNNRKGMVTDINVTPLVDIMLVLLIVFMLTSGAMVEQDRNDIVQVDLPTAASAENKPAAPLSVVLNEAGDLFVDGKQLSPQRLKATVKARISESPDTSAVLSADKRASHGAVVAIIDVLRLLGVKDVALNTKVQEIES